MRRELRNTLTWEMKYDRFNLSPDSADLFAMKSGSSLVILISSIPASLWWMSILSKS